MRVGKEWRGDAGRLRVGDTLIDGEVRQWCAVDVRLLDLVDEICEIWISSDDPADDVREGFLLLQETIRDRFGLRIEWVYGWDWCSLVVVG